MAKAGTILLSGMDVARAAYEAGFRGDALTTAVAVAKAESSWYRDVISVTNDYGLWQINAPAHPSYNTQQLLDDAGYNARAAFAISGQGKNWNPWYAWKDGLHKPHLTSAVTSVNAFLGWGGATAGPGGGIVPPSPGVAAPGNQVGPFAFAGVTAPAAPKKWNPASFEYKTSYRQQMFDKRMQAAPGMQRALKDAKIGPTHVGWIEPLNEKSLGYDRPAGYKGHAVAVPGGAKGPWGGTNGPIYTGEIGISGSNGGAVDVSAPLLACFFLFNPNEIQLSYSANPMLLPIAALDQTQVNPNLPMSDPNNTVSFQLYFDRTYEVCDGSKLGVYLDIRQLEQLTGISPEQPVMRSYPVKIFFGKPADFHLNALITSMNIAYVHFSHEMVPMRATVDIVARRLSSVHPMADQTTTEFYGDEKWREKVIEEGPPNVASMGPKK